MPLKPSKPTKILQKNHPSTHKTHHLQLHPSTQPSKLSSFILEILQKDKMSMKEDKINQILEEVKHVALGGSSRDTLFHHELSTKHQTEPDAVETSDRRHMQEKFSNLNLSKIHDAEEFEQLCNLLKVKEFSHVSADITMKN